MRLKVNSLHPVFGNEEEQSRSALEKVADKEEAVASEPLAVGPTGREAIQAMLEGSVIHYTQAPGTHGFLFSGIPGVLIRDEEIDEFLKLRRTAVEMRIWERIEKSVADGELPEGANVGAITNLCTTVLAGLTFRAFDGVPLSTLSESIQLFVDSLGFHARRPATKRTQSPSKNDRITQTR